MTISRSLSGERNVSYYYVSKRLGLTCMVMHTMNKQMNGWIKEWMKETKWIKKNKLERW